LHNILAQHTQTKHTRKKEAPRPRKRHDDASKVKAEKESSVQSAQACNLDKGKNDFAFCGRFSSFCGVVAFRSGERIEKAQKERN